MAHPFGEVMPSISRFVTPGLAAPKLTFVDRNRHKNLTLNKAKEQGIRHARLPIQKHLALSGTHVLTVNQVVDIILAQLELKNWDLAMEKAVPMRKHAKEEPGKQTKEEGDGELSE